VKCKFVDVLALQQGLGRMIASGQQQFSFEPLGLVFKAVDKPAPENTQWCETESTNESSTCSDTPDPTTFRLLDKLDWELHEAQG
jgi:hypothetical protein